MTYNVLHGFRKTKSPYQLEEERLKAAQKMIREVNPDVLGITEACYSVPNQFNILMDYRNLFNFKYSISCPSGPEWGGVLLSQHPIIDAQPISTQNGYGIRSKIMKEGKIIHVDLVHPKHDITEINKMSLLELFLKNKPETYIILGDLNAYSDTDDYDRKKLIETFRTFNPENAESAVDILLERRLIPYIKSQNLLDVFGDSKELTIPTPKYSNGSSTGARIDYIFHTPDIKVLSSEVIKREGAEIASDHYPITAILELK